MDLHVGLAVNIDLLKLLNLLLSDEIGRDETFAFDESSTSQLTRNTMIFKNIARLLGHLK
jgi:hypothetical protein